MNSTFTQSEADFVISWAKEDHCGSANGPARSLQRTHGIHSAVFGQLFARLSTLTGRSQHDLVEGPIPETPIVWPWPTQEAFEERVKALLPGSTLQFLEGLGALAATVN